LPDWLQQLFNDYGYYLVFAGVFLNNLGLPIPGDTLLLGAGFLAEDGPFDLVPTIAVGTAACFLGGTCGYGLGRRLGRKFLRRLKWIPLTPEREKQLDRFFRKHGAKAVFFARFVALAHPVTGLLTGMGKTPFKPFLVYNLAGSLVYALVYTLLGYFFGASWNVLKEWAGRTALYALVIVLVLAFLTVLLRRFSRKIVKE